MMVAVDAVRHGWTGGSRPAHGVSGRHGAAPTDAPTAPCGAAGRHLGRECTAATGVEALQTRLAGLLQALQDSALAGLGAVEDLLARLGVGGAEPGGVPDAGGTAAAGGAAIAAGATLRERATLRIVTQEGDVVELELRARAAFDVAAAAGASADGAVAVASGRVISGARLEIHVHGELNQAELAAIGEAIDQVEALAAQFHAGDLAAAFAAAGALQIDGAQLASVAVDLRQSLRMWAAATAMAIPQPAT